MSRNGYTGPKLPRTLLDQVQNTSDSRFQQNGASRKAQRKAERLQKKAIRAQPSRRHGMSRRQHVESDDDSLGDEKEIEAVTIPKQAAKKPLKDVQPVKSILKKTKPVEPEHFESSEEEELSDAESLNISSRAAKAGLADDDAEITALEKKLGIRGKKPEEAQQDEFDWLVGGSESGSDDGDSRLKRKRPEDSKWLRDKRLKASGASIPDDLSDDASLDEDTNASENDLEEDDIEYPFSDDQLDSDDFDGFDDDMTLTRKGLAEPPKRQRENPYVAPMTNDTESTAKYIPPSLRKPASSDEEALRQLRRQLQGLLNRLSEANMLSILQSLEDIYSRNARQHVTSTLIDLLVGLISDLSVLNDTFLILHAGFAEAVYKVIGTDFGAQLLEKLVESIDHARERETYAGKQTLNLLAYVSNLYNFQLVGSTMLFDYVRVLLGELSETNTELLLRIIRTSGQQLRQDDPSALKDIVILLQRSVASIGEDQLSVRTKFMIETIHNLKNNRVKTGAAGSTLAAEHTTRMKKILTSVNSTRSVKATEPLRVSLADIHDSEKKGKWWLVGASYHDPAKLANNDNTPTSAAVRSSRREDADAGYDSETPGSVNLHRLARSQGMNTDVRRAIFIAVLSSADFKEAHERVLKLHLKNKQMVEVPRILVHCVGAEEAYNPFYALVGRRFCGERRLRKAFMFQLWDVLRRIGGDDGDEEDELEVMGLRKMVNVAKFYGFLIADGGLSLGVLKKLDPDFAYLDSDTGMFVEVLLNTVLLTMWRSRKEDGHSREQAAKDVFGSAAGAGGIIPGLKHVLENKVARGELARTKKEKKAVEMGCQHALEALDEAARAGPVAEEDEDDIDEE